MPKELFDQQLFDELDDNDRIIVGVPDVQAGKNMLYSSLKTIMRRGAADNWHAQTINARPAIFQVGDELWMLKDGTVIPYESLISPNEDANFVKVGDELLLALTSDVEVAIPTEDVKYTSPKKAFEGFLFWVNNTIVSELSTASKKIIGAINELYNSIWVRQPVFVGICQKCPILSTDITRDDATRTLTINSTKGGAPVSQTNPIRFYTNNGSTPTMYEKHISQSVQWSNTKGLKYIYFDTDGILKSSDTVWDFSNITTIWRLYWDPNLSGANRIVRESIEYHVNTISSIDHKWKHRYGTIWVSGFDIVTNASLAGTPNASGLNTCISLTGGVAIDDNLPYTVINSITPADFSQDLGMTTAVNITISNAGVFDITYNAPDGTLTVIQGTRFPFHFIADVPQIVTAGGIITPVSANYFFNYYIYSFQDPRYGKVINARSGGQYASKSEADAETWELVKAASPTLQDGEVRQLYKTTWERKTTFSSAIKQSALRSYVDLRQNAAIAITAAGAAGVSLASNVMVDATGFNGTLDNTVTNVQILAQKVDDLYIPVVETIDIETIEEYDPAQAYLGGNTYKSYVNLSSIDPQFQSPAIYRCVYNAAAGQTPETHPYDPATDTGLWWYLGADPVEVSTRSTANGSVRQMSDLQGITGVKSGDTVGVRIENYNNVEIIYMFNALSTASPATYTVIKPFDVPLASPGRWELKNVVDLVIKPTVFSLAVGNDNVMCGNNASVYVNAVNGRTSINLTLVNGDGFATDVFLQHQKKWFVVIDNSANSSAMSFTFTLPALHTLEWVGSTAVTSIAAGKKARLWITSASKAIVVGAIDTRCLAKYEFIGEASGGGDSIYNGQFNFSSLDSFSIPYARAITLTSVIKSSSITDLRIGKNGETPATLTFPYSIAASDLITFAATYDRESQAYFTLIGTKS